MTPNIAHQSFPSTTSPKHWVHQSILALTSPEEVTTNHAHNFSQQDKHILRILYAGILRSTESIQTLFPTDPSEALKKLSLLNQQLRAQLQ